jgi:hypothetical protein
MLTRPYGSMTEKGLQPAQASPFEGQRLALLASADFVPFELYLNILYTLQQYGLLMRRQLQSLRLSQTRLFETLRKALSRAVLDVKRRTQLREPPELGQALRLPRQCRLAKVPGLGQSPWALTSTVVGVAQEAAGL